MTTKTYKTEEAFKRAVKRATAEGHVFLGYTWDAACFKDLVIFRHY